MCLHGEAPANNVVLSSANNAEDALPTVPWRYFLSFIPFIVLLY